MRTALTFGALVALIAVAGCGGEKKTVTVGDTTATTSDDNKTATVTTKDGSMSVGTNAVDPSKLGAPSYPGATQDSGGGALSFTTSEGTSSTAVLKSSDPFEKVYDFYKAQMPPGSEKMKLASGGDSMATFQVGESGSKEQSSVTIVAKDAEPGTTITINHTVKSDSAMASAAPAASPSP